MRILLLDIENAPNLAHVWKIWDENIGLTQLLKSGYILSWAAKWHGEKEIFFSSLDEDYHRDMLSGIHKLLNEADVVVHYNGKRHDIPHLNKAFIQAGFNPPAPYKQVDLLTVVKNKFKFVSNKLEYVVKELGLGEKIKNEGHTLWIKCMAGDHQAWKKMKEYNVNDVILLESLYDRVLPWISNHPNRSVYQTALGCVACGGKNYVRRGISVSKERRYQRYQCKSCGSWFRNSISEGPKAGEKFSAI